MRRIVIAIVACGLLSIISGQTSVPQPVPVQVVMLGTGTPLPDPERSGPSIAIVVDNKAYLFDAGTGVVRRAAAARQQKGDHGSRTAHIARRVPNASPFRPYPRPARSHPHALDYGPCRTTCSLGSEGHPRRDRSYSCCLSGGHFNPYHQP